MTNEESKARLRQLLAAMKTLYKMPNGSMGDCIRRVFWLMKLCPWLSEDEVVMVGEYVAGPDEE